MALLRTARLHNGVGCALLLLIGWGDSAPALPVQIAAAGALIFLCAAAHLVNDVVDLPADRTNRPLRPLVCGQVSNWLVRRAAAMTLVTGWALGLVAIPSWWGWWLFWGLAGPGYSLLAKGRGWWAPLWTATVVGSCYLAGAVAEGVTVAEGLVTAVIIYFVVFREAVKSCEDTGGDLRAGYRGPLAGRMLGPRQLIPWTAPLLLVAAVALACNPVADCGPLQIAAVGFGSLPTAAVVVLRWPALRQRHLPGTILKVCGFCGLPLLWRLAG